MKSRKKVGVTSEIKSPVTSDVKGIKSRQFRDKLTRVTAPIKGKETHAMQWNRWSP